MNIWNCPNCGGWGHMNNGSCGFGVDAEGKMHNHYKSPTECWVCQGSGKVTVTAAPKEKIERLNGGLRVVSGGK